MSYKPHPQLADKAEELARDMAIIDSYDNLFKGYGFFLTTNDELKGFPIPGEFPASPRELMDKWLNKVHFVTPQRKYLLYLAQMDVKESVTPQTYHKLKNAYKEWNDKYSNYDVVDYGEDARWACNLFLGEALYRAGLTQMDGKRYYSAAEVYKLIGNFVEVPKSEVARGDIAAFGGTHLEIVTKVRKHSIADDGFCSRGAGRGPSGNGEERCDYKFWFGDRREINDSTIKFVRVKS